jgi:hypothetical protein
MARGKPPTRARRRGRGPSGAFEGEVRAGGPGGRFTFVEVPDAEREAWGLRGPVAVAARVEGVACPGELVPDRRGVHCLALPAGLLAAIGRGVGDRVRVELEGAGGEARAMPEPLREALARSPGAAEAFESWSAAEREDLVRFVAEASDEASEVRRVATALARLDRNRPLVR